MSSRFLCSGRCLPSWLGLFVSLWGALFPNPALAQCESSPWIVVTPGPKVTHIQPRQVLLFSASPHSQYLQQPIRQLGRELVVYLWSVQDSVPLTPIDRQKQDDQSWQVLMQPARPLLAGKEYELRAHRNGEDVYYFFQNKPYGPEKRYGTQYRWHVVDAPDTAAPTWLTAPVMLKKVYAPNSEGTDHYVSFSLPLRDSSTCLIKTTVRHLRSGDQTVSYLQPWQDGTLGVGYFTCGGEFRFASDEQCSVTFEAIDAASNRSRASGAPILFSAPHVVPDTWNNGYYPRSK